MSTIDYGIYKIGTIGWEGPNSFSQLPDSTIPTYGLWAGPGWAGGDRPLTNAKINWTTDPCMNNTIIGSSTPDQCISLVDAITKTHDWNYYQAEENGNDRQMIINADTNMLKAVAATTGSGAYELPTGI